MPRKRRPGAPTANERKGIIRATLLIATLATLLYVSSASAQTPQQAARHDRDLIRFFTNHPKQAATPAGQLQLWRILHRLSEQLRTLQAARVIAPTNDWGTAVRLVQRVYPGSSWWLLSCSASEGGHGGFVMNRHGSGAGGQLQYFESTFWTDFNAAVQDLHQRGIRVPRSAWSWYSPLGQALAGGWAYGHARPAGKWTGSGC